MKCKLGDLAFIRKAIRKENIGKIVTCVKHVGHYNRGDKIIIHGEAWAAIDTDDFWLVSGNIKTMYGKATEGYIPDSWLSPIQPLNDDEETETDAPLVDELALTP
jgi:hypothetical protein